MVVRELITKLGFQVDDSELKMAERRLKETGENLRKVGREGMKFITLPLTLVGGFALKSASDIEQLGVAFTTMLDSAEKAQKLIKELIDFATRTPFQMPDVQRNAKLLLGMGIEAEKMIPTMKALGDIAAGVGGDLSRIALNYGQVRTQNRLTGREIRDFAVNGIPVLEALANTLGKTKQEITEMTSKGQISFEDVEKAFIDLTSEGGKFNNLMIKQSKTLQGRFSNLIDSLIKIGVPLGNMIADVFRLKDGMQFLSITLDKVGNWLMDAPKGLRNMIVIVGTLAALLPVIVFGLGSIFKLLSFIMGSKVVFGLGILIGKVAILTAGILTLMLYIDDFIGGLSGKKSLLFDFFKEIPFMFKTVLSEISRGLSEFIKNPFNYFSNTDLSNYSGAGSAFPGMFPMETSEQQSLRSFTEKSLKTFNITINSNPAFPEGALNQDKMIEFREFTKSELASQLKNAVIEAESDE